MKIKIGDKFYTNKEQPIMIILNDNDKINIKNMLPHCNKYCEYDNKKYSQEQIEQWMDEKE